jgi:hypothetical protein
VGSSRSSVHVGGDVLIDPFNGVTIGANGETLINGKPASGNSGPANPAPAQLTDGSASPLIDLSVNYGHQSVSHFDTTSWAIGLAPVWYTEFWRFGPAVGFQTSDTSGFTTDTWNYGAFAEAVLSPVFTASARGGWFSISHGSDGYYLGGGLRAFVIPDLLLNGAVDYTHYDAFGGSDETDYTLGAEYLISRTTPISIYGGYVRSEFGHGFSSDTWFLGIKLYDNQPTGLGVDSLAYRQHTGVPGPHQFKF